jgi:hypothetical protein
MALGASRIRVHGRIDTYFFVASGAVEVAGVRRRQEEN